MFELTISTSLDKQSYINELYKKLLPEIKNVSGICIKENLNKRCHFSIAIRKEEKEYFKAKILDHIVFMIIDDYKYNYFKEELNILNEPVVYQSFLKAISIFDADADREFIKKQIVMKDEILIDSLYYFKLQELRNRWNKTVDIIHFNQILSNKSSMLEILKYLTTMSDNIVENADIVISKKALKLKHYENTKNYKHNFYGLSNMLTEIIELNPAKINLRVCDDGDDEIVEILSKIFYDKINFSWFKILTNKK